MNLNPEQLDLLVEEALKHSDQDKANLINCAKTFIKAHELVPWGPSLEIGSRRGGSAFLFLSLLALNYAVDGRPLLFTVDPYGNKPYEDGDPCPVKFNAYGTPEEMAMKTLLLPFGNHTHFRLRGGDFLQALRGRPYWHQGRPACFGSRDLSFAFLDGDHDATIIRDDLHYLWQSWMSPKGLVLVDNVNKDPRTLPILESNYVFERSTTGIQAMVTGRKTQ